MPAKNNCAVAFRRHSMPHQSIAITGNETVSCDCRQIYISNLNYFPAPYNNLPIPGHP